MKTASSPQWWLEIYGFADPNVPITPGSDINYNIYFYNFGDVPATGTVLVDTLDSFTEYLYHFPGGIYDHDTRTVTFSLGTIEPQRGGIVEISVRIPYRTPHGTRIVNTAFITCAEGVNRDTSLTLAVDPTPILTIQKMTHVRAPFSGREMVYDIDYGNVGNVKATNVILSDYLPERTTFVSCTHGCIIETPSGKRDPAMDMVFWRLGELQAIDPSDLPDIQLTVRVDNTYRSKTVLTNRACITCAEHIDSDLCSEVTDTVGSPPVLSCSLKGRDSFVRAGEEILYLFQCENSGWSRAHSIVVVDTLPEHAVYVACSGGGRYDDSTEEVSWTIEKMDRGEGETFTLRLRIKSPVPDRSLLINKVDLTCAEGFCASAVETTVVLSSPIWDLSTVAVPHEIVRGQPITFRTSIKNIGTMNAKNTIVTNPIPDKTTYSNNTGGGIFEEMAHRVVWNIGPVHVNEEREISLTVLVESNFPTEKEVVNRVYVQSDERADSISISLSLILPQLFHVSQNYPNPFNQMTTITVQLPEDASLDVRIYNILGQEIGTLLRGHRQAGAYTIQWDGRSIEGRDFTSGVYIYRVVVNNGQWSETRRMMMLK